MRNTILTGVAIAIFATSALASPYDKSGFVTFEKDGRLWVFRENSPELAEYKKHGEPDKHYTDIGNGPNGMTVKAGDDATLKAYLQAMEK